MTPGLRARLEHGLRLAIACACFATAPGWAQTEAPARPAFTLDIRAPDAIRTLLDRHLELRRYRAVTDLDEAELARLARLTERDARELVGTLGYFSPRIDIRQEPGGPEGVPTVVVEVVPGPQTTVGSLDIAFEGDIQTSEEPAAIIQRGRIRETWTLPVGRPFTQDGWDDAKSQALRELVARRYPAGKVSYSLAEVDAVANRAALGLRLDSGPLFRLGPMQVSGMQRYDPVLAPRIARLLPGSIYDQDQIQRAQLRLVGSGYFDSAFIYVDPAADPAAAPVQVTLREAPLHRVVLGVGLSTDSGPRASLEYTHNQLPGIGWRAVTKLQLETKSPYFQTELTAVPGEDGWRWGVLGRIDRLDDGALITDGRRLRVGRTRVEERIDRNVYLQYDSADVQAAEGAPPPQDTGDGTSLGVNYIWNGRYFDRVPYPTDGFFAGAEFGGGITLTGSKSPFQRTVLRWLEIHPVGRGRIQWRAEGGSVLAAQSARVPATQLFRTGGDNSVRGYALREIGAERVNGVVVPGRFLAVGSIEYQQPIRRGGVDTPLEAVAFVDAGAVANHPTDFRPSVGVGVGVRFRSPLGPLQVDLAYGVQVQHFRLHINIASTVW
jgi:translocation and assembly module TamA